MVKKDITLYETINPTDGTEIKKISGFWLGILVGVVGSVLGGAWTTVLIRWADSKNPFDIHYLIPLITLSIFLALFFILLYYKIVIKIKT